MRDFRKLETWTRSHALALDPPTLSQMFPSAELLRLTPRPRCAAISIPSCFAGGSGRDRPAGLKRPPDIAHGSASDPDALLFLAADLRNLGVEQHTRGADELDEPKRMPGSFSRRLIADR